LRSSGHAHTSAEKEIGKSLQQGETVGANLKKVSETNPLNAQWGERDVPTSFREKDPPA